MKNFVFWGLGMLCILASCNRTSTSSTAVLNAQDARKVVLVGGSLISGMEEYAFFEQGLLRYFGPDVLSWRNIGWPADDVYGLARSQFGSAQNTRSWQPPTAEEGFGSKVLMEHIEQAAPRTLIIGYGSEVAFAEDEKDFELFTSGYKRLLSHAENLGIKLVLLSPPRHEKYFVSDEKLSQRNTWLERTHTFIQDQAQTRGHLFIDLYTPLISDPQESLFTENGVQLNRGGYERMSKIMLESLGLATPTAFGIKLNADAEVTDFSNCLIHSEKQTVNGRSFYLKPQRMLSAGEIISPSPVAVYVNGRLTSKSQDSLSHLPLWEDSLRQSRLLETIKEKNRLYRYRLRPLNEAYIYLFRRHEMGHLAYEMDDLDQLVKEKEREINQMISEQEYLVEIETIRPWKSPKDYPEDEVPAFVPEPNIEQELASFHTAKGFEVNLFAADPMIANPININWDTHGRAWVATSSTYPHIVPGREPNDKIIILEDTDQDGVADKHTVFAENLFIPHSVMPVPGGAYVAATTELLFLADTDGDDVADERRVVYDGFGNADVHHMIHGLRWMPWGDLHFTQSIYINSFVETPYGTRILNGSGIWSFRPETERLEVFTRGLINPWGEAIDQWGQSFATDGAGSSGINYLFPGSAHATAVGASKVLPGLNSGTPKNTAAEVIYSRHFPSSWQGSVITNDFRANRTVRYQLSPKESGYSSEEVQTVLHSDHRSYRPVDSKIGPDGALYIVDWYNPIIDHGEVDFHHPIRDKSHGRVWRLTQKGSPTLPSISFSQLESQQLLDLLKSSEQITRTLANRAYVEQKGDPQLVVAWTKRQANPQHRLEGLWLQAALNHYDEESLRRSLRSATSQERAAALRLLGQGNLQGAYMAELERLIQDPHPQVRLESLHALRMMGGLEGAEQAIKVREQALDSNLEFALELTLQETQEAWLPLLMQGKPIFGGQAQHQLYALLATEDVRSLGPLSRLVENADLDPILIKKAWTQMARMGDSPTRQKVLEKAAEEENVSLLRTLANAPAAYDAIPPNLESLRELFTHPNRAIRKEAFKLAARWKTQDYESLISAQVGKTDDLNEKIEGLRAMASWGGLNSVQGIAKSDLNPLNQVAAQVVWLEEDTEAAGPSAVALLAKLEDPKLAEALFMSFRRLEKGPAVLEKNLDGKELPEKTASVGLRIMETAGLNLTDLIAALRLSGNIQPIGNDLSEAEKEQLIQAALSEGNIYRGRTVYRRKELQCATCHRIGNAGGLIGPNLSTVGSYMTPNSLLESILNPNTDIKQNYETVLITHKDGEVSSGLLHRKTGSSVLLRQTDGSLKEIPSAEIAKTDVSPVSLMPTGLTRDLHEEELRDLLAYLVRLGS